MFDASTLTFQEFMTQDPYPLAILQQAAFEFLRNREDAVLFGAQAVNAYVTEPRTTQDIDLLSLRAGELAQELRDDLNQQFHISVRVRQLGKGQSYRIYQIRKAGNRHLVHLRHIETLPETRRITNILVMAPADLIASKLMAYHQGRGRPKSGTDWRDIALLLLTFPELKQHLGPVTDRLREIGAGIEVMNLWVKWVNREIQAPNEDEGF